MEWGGIVSLLNSDNAVVDFVTQAKVPFVDLSILREDVPAPRVVADNYAIGKAAADCLLPSYRDFTYFSTSDDKVSQTRKIGFFDHIEHRASTVSDWS